MREKLGGISPAGVEEIFLPQMAKVSADFAGDVPMIVYNQTNIGPMKHRQDFFGQAAHFIGSCAFGAKLNQIRAAVAQLPGDGGGLARSEIGGVNESVEAALRQWLHNQACSSINSRRAPPSKFSRKFVV